MPKCSPARWLTSSDYPTAKLLRGEQAITAFRLLVGPVGRATGCSVQSHIARNATFAQTTCAALIRLARFTPARPATGETVASYLTNRARWVIP
ncbi:MAG: energy transducer TonB [Sphingomonadales bacterium]|nr:energy transducer TonB [Sphingomonadales bacterium]